MAINAIGNGIPFLKGEGISSSIKKAMILWYDLKRQGATNESMKTNPILKDLSGNGHDAACYNFAWSGMSGIGGYTNFIEDPAKGNFEILGTQKWLIKSLKTESGLSKEPIVCQAVSFNGHGKTLTIKVDGIPEGSPSNFLVVRNNLSEFVVELHNGDNTVTFSEDTEGYFIFRIDGLPILTDYTVIAKRKRLDADLTNRGALASKLKNDSHTNGAFVFEYIQPDTGVKQIVSFGTYNTIQMVDTDISYMTKNSYNGATIISGQYQDNNHLTLFSVREYSGCAQAALYSFILFNRTLTYEEIEWVKQNLIEGDVEI